MDRTERAALLISLLSIPVILFGCWKIRETSFAPPAAYAPRATSDTRTNVQRYAVATSTPAASTTTTTAPVTATTTTTTTTTAPPTTAPQVKVARGISHSCSWTQLGGVWCWGSNHQGELGHLGYGSNTPVKVEGLPRNIRKVVAADHTTCAAGDEDGARVAYCWGYRLGGGADADPVSAWGPNQVRLPNVTDVALGTSGQVCVVSTSGDASSIYCWGDGWSHVGTGGFDGGHFTSKPVLVGTYRHVHHLEVGYRTTRAHVGFDDGGCGWIAWGEGYGYGVVARI